MLAPPCIARRRGHRREWHELRSCREVFQEVIEGELNDTPGKMRGAIRDANKDYGGLNLRLWVRRRRRNAREHHHDIFAVVVCVAHGVMGLKPSRVS